MMQVKIFVFSAFFSLGFLIVVLEFVRGKRLKEQYSLLWILTGLVMIALTLWRNLLERLAAWLGIHYAPSLLFMAGILFCFILILHYSVIISRLHTQNVRLAQEIGILGNKLEDIIERTDGGKDVEDHSIDNV